MHWLFSTVFGNEFFKYSMYNFCARLPFACFNSGSSVSSIPAIVDQKVKTKVSERFSVLQRLVEQQWRYKRSSWYLKSSRKLNLFGHLCQETFFRSNLYLPPMGPRVLPLLSGVFWFCACKAPGDRDPGVMVINVSATYVRDN